MRIMLVTDAWEPQVNGVVRTLTKTVAECRAMGHEVEVIHPGLGYKTFPLPTYPEIKMSLGAKPDIERRIKDFAPDGIHIATEGSLGQAARSLCLKWGWPYSTSYHTKFPEYVSARFPFIPLAAGYWFMRRFHNTGGCMMVATPSMRDDLATKGFKNIIPWARGVDTQMFRPELRDEKNGMFKDLPKPIFLNVGRVAVEKNIEKFLETDLPGTKIVVGDGPALETLRAKYPDAVFTGNKFGEDLARHFADADVFVFPSLTDTFGLVILESMACGTPVAGFCVPGPKDIIPGSNAGAVNDDLRVAAMACLELNRNQVRAYAETYSWKACAEEFVNNLEVPPMSERRRFWKRLRRLGGRVRFPLPKRLRRRKNR
ncbi:MAG: glycosyltransferase family 1 protein [Robiginitomaculum sp.]|nr:glycosyltransferase family 1 protein [Robiginitomaculum sp.]